jgi:hypothetical protein
MITSSRACFQIPTLPPNKNTVRHSKSSSTSNFDFKLKMQDLISSKVEDKERLLCKVLDQILNSHNAGIIRSLSGIIFADVWQSEGLATVGPQSFCRSTPDFLFRVFPRQNRRLAGFPSPVKYFNNPKSKPEAKPGVPVAFQIAFRVTKV